MLKVEKYKNLTENKLWGAIFFEIKLLLQPDVVFDSESNGRNLNSLAPPGGDKKLFSIFFQNDVTSSRGCFYQIFLPKTNA